MAFAHLLCYLIRPYPSKTYRSDDLFINAAIVQLAAYEIGDRAAELWPENRSVFERRSVTSQRP